MIFEYFTELFPYEKFAVEYEAYKSLIDCKDLNYIAVPWTQILNSGWIKYPNGNSADYYFKILSKEKISQQNNFELNRSISIRNSRSPNHRLNIN